QRRLRALATPCGELLGIDLDEGRRARGVVQPDLFDEAAVAWRFGLGDDDAIEGALFAAVTGETDLHHVDVFLRSAPEAGRQALHHRTGDEILQQLLARGGIL